MRDYGKVHTSFWTSSTTRAMSEDGRALALYLLTSPHSNQIGCFRLPDGYVADDMQWPAERVSEGFGELFRNGFATRDQGSSWVFIRLFLKWNLIEKATVAELVNGAMRYAAERQGEDPKYTKQPATWLNAEAWLNIAPPASPGHRLPTGQPQSRSESAMAGILSYGMTQEAPYVDGPVIEG